MVDILIVNVIVAQLTSGQMSTPSGSTVTRKEKLLVGVMRLLGTDDHLASLNRDIDNSLK